MAQVQTRIFKSNRSQAVHLPKGIAFPESVKDVEITALGTNELLLRRVNPGTTGLMRQGFPVIL